MNESRSHTWRVEALHCLSSGAIVFLVVLLLGVAVHNPAAPDSEWFAFGILLMAGHILLISLAFLLTTRLKSLRSPSTLGMASCITSGLVIGGVDLVVLSVWNGGVPPIGMVVLFLGLGGSIGLMYRLCQNAHFNPAVNP